MKKRNYKSTAPVWCVTNRTKRLEKNYKGWNQPPKKPCLPPKYKPRWVSRANNTTEEN